MSKELEEQPELKLEKRWFTFLLSKEVPPIPTSEERKPYPESTSNIFNRVLFSWIIPVMNVGYKRTLVPEDLFYLTDDVKVDTLTNDFYKYFEQEVTKAKKKYLKAQGKQIGDIDEDDLKDFELSSFLTIRALFKTFKWRYSFALISLIISQSSQTLNPLIIKKLIYFVETRAAEMSNHVPMMGVGKGVGYAVGATILILLNGVFMNHALVQGMLVGAMAKSVLNKAILDKSFRLHSSAKHEYSVGKITSIMGTDLSRIDFAIGLQIFALSVPVPIIIAIIILLVTIGPYALVGMALMIIFIFGVTFAVRRLYKFRKAANFFTDKRVNYIKEILNNLRIIKYYSWEPPYYDNIADVRKKEMNILYKMAVIKNVITAFSMCLTLYCSMITFLIIYGVGGKRDPASVFSSLSLFNVLTQIVFLVPQALAAGVDGLVAIGRVGTFMIAPEEKESENSIIPDEKTKLLMDLTSLAIKVDHGTFEWETFKDEITEQSEKVKSEQSVQSDSSAEGLDDEETLNSDAFPGLNDINLEIRKGELVVVTGLIGSGKSSLLNALSGFMKRTRGSVSVNGSMILCGQPWIQNSTVKENILFGSEFDEKKYAEVIYACSLESDLSILPAGDRTEIGERGITLSGGQKARINLARSVYFDKEVILMDDVLSAVDARVGKHIMENCIMGLLREKTRILATHQLSLISSADRIIFLNGDGSIHVGTFEELHANNDGFNKLMAFNQATESKEQTEEEEETEDPEEQEKAMIERQITKTVTKEDEEAARKVYNQDADADGRLVLSESKAKNGIDSKVYNSYIENGSGVFGKYLVLLLIAAFMTLSTFCMIFTNVWLSFWTSKKFHGLSNAHYIGVYVMFVVLANAFLIVQFVLVVYITNKAATFLNIKATKNILHSPMSFLDTTPMGRVLNRFTKDTDVLDDQFSEPVRFFLFTFANLIGYVILCVVFLPWFALAVPIFMSLFLAIGHYYSSSAKEIKRLEGVQRSFVYNNFNESLNGMSTIKAYGASHRFLAINSSSIDTMNEAYYLTIVNQRWLSVNLAIIATFFTLTLALLCVFGVFSISASSTGLLLSYTLQLTGQFSLLIRNYTQIETSMTSVERICDFAIDLKEEGRYHITETDPGSQWPSEGSLVFKNVSLAYRPGLPLVLKNLNANIKGREKIGICGRTGAGKSSIMTALYRIAELSEGKIEIDGVDISTLGLNELRSKLSIIPQDPVLFRGSLRKNLDPFGQNTDASLWDALRRAGLIEETKVEAVSKQLKGDENLHKFHLDQMVEDDGSNFSLGERQLIALARALIRDSKILILDEATASVDYKTDSKIQNTIVNEFGHCTILCIAHRLKTIINYDRILVLDKGEIQEFDTPWNLFNDKGSIFQQMCEKSAIVSEDFQRKD
ncbi:oligomycin resistance ATP-dependent permease Yor1p [[Candida] jaroonii]|uniref:Oligomycin resistance ATP-dependent permease Yor1p n=1 Tax=[Candida] jaroonii TaxID=467808 RepID=A0ACA9Y4U7_9ASCO|nr:oligomycin resistance ATP-dependent permease Yor1p [[Candida] jaroonii]